MAFSSEEIFEAYAEDANQATVPFWKRLEASRGGLRLITRKGRREGQDRKKYRQNYYLTKLKPNEEWRARRLELQRKHRSSEEYRSEEARLGRCARQRKYREGEKYKLLVHTYRQRAREHYRSVVCGGQVREYRCKGCGNLGHSRRTCREWL